MGTSTSAAQEFDWLKSTVCVHTTFAFTERMEEIFGIAKLALYSLFIPIILCQFQHTGQLFL